LSTSFEYVGSGQPYENGAVLNRESGEFLWRSECSGNLDDEWPDGVENDERYLAIPHKRELDLGKPLAIDFVWEFLPDAVDECTASSAAGAPTPGSRLNKILIPRRPCSGPSRRMSPSEIAGKLMSPHPLRCRPFETRPAAAPQGEVSL
jgi:hypothetical protein